MRRPDRVKSGARHGRTRPEDYEVVKIANELHIERQRARSEFAYRRRYR